MQHLNNIQIIGGVVRVPEVKAVGTTHVARVSLAVTTKQRTKEGFKEEVCYVDVNVWGERAQNAANLRKGQRVFVSGRLKQENWEDKTTKEKKSKFVIQAESFVHEGELTEDIVLHETPAAKLYNAPDNKKPTDPFKKEQAPAGRPYKAAPIAEAEAEEDYSNSDLPF